MSYGELPDSFRALEEEILEEWTREGTFEESVRAREGAPEFVFYEGPPTANGRPGVHHIISRTIKDLVARYRTMSGHHVTRIAGWDTHGLPVEIEAEKQLGISGKPEIEELGIGEFNRVCRENLFTYKDEWERLSRRIGYWLDYDRAYITCSPEYVESVWWALSEIDRRGLLYRGHKVLPYCPRCGTGLSSHEVAQGYEERSDPSLYALFPIEERAGREDAPRAPDRPRGSPGAPRGEGPGESTDRYLLVWTTTPWTLVSNVAVAFGPGLEYVEVEARLSPRGSAGSGGDAAAAEGDRPAESRAGSIRVLVSRRRAEALASGDRGVRRGRDGTEDGGEETGGRPSPAAKGPAGEIYRIAPEALERARPVSAGELDGLAYRRPLRLVPGYREARGTLYPAEFVSDEEGTGFVHLAPAFGADDFRLGRERGLPVVRPVDDEGRFEADVEEVGGLRVKEADARILELLRAGGLLFRAGRLRHSYPHCWRCASPLIYMARGSWYARTTEVKDRLLSNNAAIDWNPPEIGSGRMGEWLENNVDWALSRDRYWGTPLPIWECGGDRDHREVIGSYEELEERVGGLPSGFDPHRPEIDRLSWECADKDCGGRMTRVPQVLDAWFDSGSMPYAQWHYPFENDEAFGAHFPADFIAEGVDQTRGWFYSLLALSTMLFDEPAYRSVVVNDLVLDAAGRKMSKSRGNAADPWEAIREHGADAVRFYLLSSSNPWLPKRWDPEGLREVNRRFFGTLRNSYRFFALYANLEDWTPDSDVHPKPRPERERSEMDRWLLSRLDTVASEVREDLEIYDLTRAARRLSSFVVDDLSNWYVRRTRDRFWATRGPEEPGAPDGTGDGARRTADAFGTLHRALAVTARLLAPFAPFLADWIHRQVAGGESVHLADFPAAEGHGDRELERDMEHVRRLAALGRAARERAGIRVRQPLRELQAVLPGGRRPSAPLTALLREELNVKQVVFLDETSDIVRLNIKPDYGALGPRFGPETPAVARAIAALNQQAAERLKAGEPVFVEVDGDRKEIGPREVRIVEEARGELAVGSEGGYLAALDPAVDEELRREGLARELVSRVQRLRRDAGLEISDRIELRISGESGVREAAASHREYIAGETLSVRVRIESEDGEGLEHSARVEIDGAQAVLGLSRTTGGQ